jgi:hypothetical protein
MGDCAYQQVSGVSSAVGKKTAGLIEKETEAFTAELAASGLSEL